MGITRISRLVARAVALGEIVKELRGASPYILGLVDRLRTTSVGIFVSYSPFVKRRMSLRQKARRAAARVLLGLCRDPTWYFFVKLVFERDRRADIAPIVEMLTLAKRRRVTKT